MRGKCHQLFFCFHLQGFFKVLSQLTQTGDVTPEQFVSKSLLNLLSIKVFIGLCYSEKKCVFQGSYVCMSY